MFIHAQAGMPRTHPVESHRLEDGKIKYGLLINYICVVDSCGVKVEMLDRVWKPGSQLLNTVETQENQP